MFSSSGRYRTWMKSQTAFNDFGLYFRGNNWYVCRIGRNFSVGSFLETVQVKSAMIVAFTEVYTFMPLLVNLIAFQTGLPTAP